MRHAFAIALLAAGLTASAQQDPASHAQHTTAKHDVGSGAADIGKGAGGAAGNVAKGTGKGVVDLVTLHPVNAAGDVGKGAVVGGKDLAVGSAKGTGKIVKGTGKALKHIY